MFATLYVTVGTKHEARELAREAVGAKLAACANLWPIESLYIWEGSFENEREYVLLLKTRQELVAQLTRFIAQRHSYECPCIVSFEWKETHGPYAQWVAEQTRPAQVEEGSRS